MSLMFNGAAVHFIPTARDLQSAVDLASPQSAVGKTGLLDAT